MLDQRPTSRPRLPITGDVQAGLYSSLSRRPHSFERTLLWAVCSMAFFGFFRLGELLVPSIRGHVPASHLSWADVCVDNISTPSLLRVRLRVSKCDQAGRGVDVFLGSPFCPVAAVLSYMALRGPREGPFFLAADGSPLTKSVFVAALRELLRSCGLDPSSYSGHSFRIGAATTAGLAGVEDSTIKSLGRWSSNAFQIYPEIRAGHCLSKACIWYLRPEWTRSSVSKGMYENQWVNWDLLWWFFIFNDRCSNLKYVPFLGYGRVPWVVQPPIIVHP